MLFVVGRVGITILGFELLGNRFFLSSGDSAWGAAAGFSFMLTPLIGLSLFFELGNFLGLPAAEVCLIFFTPFGYTTG